ncbi:CapA family protein [Paenibacillus crassostreae]|nr:CapA family protein [Paenibacillus crassostreae]
MIILLLSYYWVTEENKANSFVYTPTDTTTISQSDDIEEGNKLTDGTSSNLIDEQDSEDERVLDSAATEVSVEPEIHIEEDESIVVNSDSVLTFNFAGDMMFAGKVEDKLKMKGYDFPFKYVSKLFQQDDLTIANLESPVTTAGIEASDKQYVFKSSPKALVALKEAGMDGVGLANNHILDQGVSGLLDTLKYLEKSKLQYAGAGKDADEAYAPTYFTRQGVKVALIAVSRVVPKSDWHAGKGNPGVATVYDPTLAIKSIASARMEADIVIVMAHWGEERALNPIGNQSELAHQFVDAGADLVIGSHPHVLQGLEQYKGKWIAYSTGNFIFTKSLTETTWKTAIFSTTCTPEGECRIKLIPFHAELGQPVPMSEEEGQQLFKDIEELSIGGVRINKEGTVFMPKS